MIDPRQLEQELRQDVREFVRFVDQQRAGRSVPQAQPLQATVTTVKLTGKSAEEYNDKNRKKKPRERFALVTPNSNGVNSNVNVP